MPKRSTPKREFLKAVNLGLPLIRPPRINIDPTNPLLYTNRAMARLKLHLYESVIPDCNSSLELLSENMKAYYYLAQAEIELERLEEAYSHAQKAYELCSGIKTGVVDKAWERSLGPVTALVLRCKKELWERKENERLKTRNSLLEDLRDLLAKQKATEREELKASADYSEEKRIELESSWQKKEEELKRLWESAADADGKRREVPDWAIDNITFAVMYDPVMVSHPFSY
jgi:STIP1 homology and U-box containing protein 1